MNESETSNSTTGVKRLAELAAYPIGALGVVLVVSAGGWWFYDTVQSGLTYSQLGEVGGVLLFIALSLWLLSRDHESSDGFDQLSRDRND